MENSQKKETIEIKKDKEANKINCRPLTAFKNNVLSINSKGFKGTFNGVIYIDQFNGISVCRSRLGIHATKFPKGVKHMIFNVKPVGNVKGANNKEMDFELYRIQLWLNAEKAFPIVFDSFIPMYGHDYIITVEELKTRKDLVNVVSDSNQTYKTNFRIKFRVNIQNDSFFNERICKKCTLIFLDKLHVCKRCQSTPYCCVECQQEDWKEHKKNCTKKITVI